MRSAGLTRAAFTVPLAFDVLPLPGESRAGLSRGYPAQQTVPADVMQTVVLSSHERNRTWLLLLFPAQ